MDATLGWYLLVTLVLVGIGFAMLVVAQPRLVTRSGGQAMAFLALFVLPVTCLWAGVSTHLESSKSTEFCLSCHVMEPYGESLAIDDEFALPASHFQNRRIDRDRACYTCHTQYTMYGDLAAKINGVRHLLVYYRGATPETIELYEPYHNRECLHCHAGARLYEEMHAEDRAEIESNELSCLECHDMSHEVASLADYDRWPTAEPTRTEGP